MRDRETAKWEARDPTIGSSARAPSARNVFACLVHEEPRCVEDLVRNLRHLDPTSEILLFNGGENTRLLNGVPTHELEALVHPRSRPVAWGRMLEYAIEQMRYALQQFRFDLLTFVDSDQLLLRPGYSAFLGAASRDGPEAGVFGDFSEYPNGPVPPETRRSAPRSAHRELDLWRPFLRRYPRGEQRFPYWSLFGATVYTRDAAAALVRLYDADADLRAILARSRMHAPEEVVLPSLAALLGFRLCQNPCRYDLMQWRADYSVEQVERALGMPEAFWIHPVPRQYQHPIRALIRTRFGGYGAS